MDNQNSFIAPISFPEENPHRLNKQLNTNKADTRCYLLLSFFIPCILVGVCWALLGVHPFGTRQILVTDFWHQYFPFANILHEKLQSFSSLYYTWESGLGSNFIAMMAYYAASPLNLLTIFFPDSFMRDGLTLILLMKIGFSGLFTGMFLKYTFSRNDISICFFSVMYALCSYILGYSWNIIWIDTVALLPLVMLGTLKLIREKKVCLYSAALALALISNYYIGLFICIFTVIAFFCMALSECRSFSHFLVSGLRMTAFTLIGAGLAAFILIPAYYALQLTYSAENSFPKEVSFYEEWLDILANMTAFRAPTVKEGLPNLYCGMLCVILTGMFLRSGQIRIREKIAAVLVLAFLIVSCNMNYLNFIWHGFHNTNMLPYRFSFLFSFAMIVMAYRVFDLVMSGKIKIFDVMAMLVIAAVFYAVTRISSKDNADVTAMWLSLGVSLFYVFVLFMYERKMIKPFIMCGLIGVGLFFEMFLHTRTCTQAVGTSDYVTYPSKNNEIEQLLEYIDSSDNELFSRTEINTWYTLNDPALYSYNGVSQFSSMANRNVTTYLRTLGLPASEAGNRYYYALNSPVVNMFTGIKYIISRNGYVLDKTTLNHLTSRGDVIAYENEYSLPIGFMTEQSILSYDGLMHSNPFEAQNSLFSKATGIDEKLFTPVEVTNTAHIGMDSEKGVYKRSYGNYRFSVDKNSETHQLNFNFIPENDCVLYAYFWADGVKKVNILHDNVNIGSYNVTKQQGFTAPIGKCSSKVKTTVSADISDETVENGSLRIYVYSMNTELLKKGYAKLLIGGVQLDDFSDTGLSGTVNALHDGICYFSIPQENGWTAYLDGEKTETKTVGGAMLAVPVKKGSHKIELHYTPEGMKTGTLISAVSFLVWFLVFIIQRNKKKSHIKEKKICEI